MSLGIALGGAARGLESAEDALARNRALSIQQQNIEGDHKLRERALGIQEAQLAREQQNDFRSQAESILGEELKIVADVIKAGREAGQSPEKINAAISPLMEDIRSLSGPAGRDFSRIERGVTATLSAPVTDSVGDAKDIAQVESGLRKEFSGLSKEFRQVRDAFARVNASAKKPSAAGDLALIFNYMKILDPGSVVREGEFATAEQAAGVPQRVINTYNRVLRGERLNDTTRADFVDRAESLFRVQETQHSKLRDQFKAIGERLKVNPENVTPDFGAVAANPIEEARAAIEAGAPRMAVLERLKENGIDPTGTGL